MTIIAASAILIYSLFPQVGGAALWFVVRVVLMPALLISSCYLGIIAEDKKCSIRSDIRWVFSKLPFVAMAFIAILLVGLQFKPPAYQNDAQHAAVAATPSASSYVLPIVLLVTSIAAFWLYRTTTKSNPSRAASGAGGAAQGAGPSSAGAGDQVSDEVAQRKTDLEFDLMAIEADLVRLYRDDAGRRVLENRKRALTRQLEELNESR